MSYSELENVNMTPYMYVFKKFISISEHFSNRIRIRGTHLADLTPTYNLSTYTLNTENI